MLLSLARGHLLLSLARGHLLLSFARGHLLLSLARGNLLLSFARGRGHMLHSLARGHLLLSLASRHLARGHWRHLVRESVLLGDRLSLVGAEIDRHKGLQLVNKIGLHGSNRNWLQVDGTHVELPKEVASTAVHLEHVDDVA